MIRLLLEAIKEWVESLLDERGRKFDVMPSNAELMAMPNNTKFFTYGYYTKDDNSGGWYVITTTWTAASKKIVVDGKTRYLVPIYDSGTVDKLYLELNRLGLRPNNGNLSNVELDTENTYAELNSSVLESLIGTEMMATFKLPQGRFFFARPWAITKAANLVGESATYSTGSASIYNNEYISGTQLCFPFLTNGQVAISGNVGGIQDISVIGNRNTYNFHIDRTKTITDPDNVVEETIATDESGEQILTTGIQTTTDLWRNVTVCNFYYGVRISTSNTYLSDIRVNRCHFGVTIGNDVKCKGIYAWDVHTPLRITGSIASVIQLRADSCVNLVNMIGSISAATIIDADGDYCTDSLIKIGDGSTWSRVRNCILSAIHGRCCALKSYDSVNGTAPKASDLTAQNSSGYGIIHVTKNCEFSNNYIILNTLQGNPFDATSGYLTPPIIFAYSSMGNMKNNHIKLNDVNVDDSEDYIKSIVQMSASNVVSYRIDTAKNTYFIEARNISTGKIDAISDIDFTTLLGGDN